jgi:hypothetical protein
MGHDHVHVGANELSRQFGKPLVISFRPAVRDDDVAAFDIAKVTQTRAESLDLACISGRRRTSQEPDLRDLAALLPPRRPGPLGGG